MDMQELYLKNQKYRRDVARFKANTDGEQAAAFALPGNAVLAVRADGAKSQGVAMTYAGRSISAPAMADGQIRIMGWFEKDKSVKAEAGYTLMLWTGMNRYVVIGSTGAPEPSGPLPILTDGPRMAQANDEYDTWESLTVSWTEPTAFFILLTYLAPEGTSDLAVIAKTDNGVNTYPMELVQRQVNGNINVAIYHLNMPDPGSAKDMSFSVEITGMDEYFGPVQASCFPTWPSEVTWSNGNNAVASTSASMEFGGANTDQVIGLFAGQNLGLVWDVSPKPALERTVANMMPFGYPSAHWSMDAFISVDGGWTKEPSGLYWACNTPDAELETDLSLEEIGPVAFTFIGAMLDNTTFTLIGVTLDDQEVSAEYTTGFGGIGGTFYAMLPGGNTYKKYKIKSSTADTAIEDMRTYPEAGGCVVLEAFGDVGIEPSTPLMFTGDSNTGAAVFCGFAALP